MGLGVAVGAADPSVAFSAPVGPIVGFGLASGGEREPAAVALEPAEAFVF